MASAGLRHTCAVGKVKEGAFIRRHIRPEIPSPFIPREISPDDFPSPSLPGGQVHVPEQNTTVAFLVLVASRERRPVGAKGQGR